MPMAKLIIDEDYIKYSPLVILSMLDIFEINLKKYNILYILIDNLTLFNKSYILFPDNCIFVISHNILIKNLYNNIDIKFVKYSLKDEYKLKDKIIKHQCIKEYLNV